VRRGAITAEDWLLPIVCAAGALWRWRLELVLAAAPLVAVNAIAPEIGEAGAKVAVVAVLLVVAAVPVTRRPLVRLLAGACLRRRWRRAWIDCGLPRVRTGGIVRVPVGEQMRVRVSRGSSLGAVDASAEQLAACLRLREVRVARDADDAACGTVTFVRRDPLASIVEVAWPHQGAESLSLWEPIPLGVDELGGTVHVSLPERNVLLGGEPGAGKSAALSMLVATAALDPTVKLWLLDGKLVELSAWAPCAERLAGLYVDEAIELLRTLRAEMDERYRVLLAAGRRKVGAGDGLPLHLVACDELAFYLTVEDRKTQREFSELLRDLVARGRAAGVIVCAATQKPAADVVPSALRDLFGFRLALRCNTPQASDTILGQGWATLGHNAAAISPGQRGVGLLLAEDGIPVQLRGFYLGDRDVDELARRAGELRSGNA
jgi:hypothetical protein